MGKVIVLLIILLCVFLCVFSSLSFAEEIRLYAKAFGGGQEITIPFVIRYVSSDPNRKATGTYSLSPAAIYSLEAPTQFSGNLPLLIGQRAVANRIIGYEKNGMVYLRGDGPIRAISNTALPGQKEPGKIWLYKMVLENKDGSPFQGVEFQVTPRNETGNLPFAVEIVSPGYSLIEKKDQSGITQYSLIKLNYQTAMTPFTVPVRPWSHFSTVSVKGNGLMAINTTEHLQVTVDTSRWDESFLVRSIEYSWAHNDQRFGDFDQSGKLDYKDLQHLAKVFGSQSQEDDITGDGLVDILDLVVIAQNLETPLPATAPAWMKNLVGNNLAANRRLPATWGAIKK